MRFYLLLEKILDPYLKINKFQDLTPDELKNVKRLEMEVHNLDDNYNFNNFPKILDEVGFKYTYKICTETDMLIHADRR